MLVKNSGNQILIIFNYWEREDLAEYSVEALKKKSPCLTERILVLVSKDTRANIRAKTIQTAGVSATEMLSFSL